MVTRIILGKSLKCGWWPLPLTFWGPNPIQSESRLRHAPYEARKYFDTSPNTLLPSLQLACFIARSYSYTHYLSLELRKNAIAIACPRPRSPNPSPPRTAAIMSATSRATTPAANGAPRDNVPSGEHELADLPAKPSLPIEEDIMQLARLGEIGAIQKLFDGKKFDASYADEQGITPLHVCGVYERCDLGEGRLIEAVGSDK